MPVSRLSHVLLLGVLAAGCSLLQREDAAAADPVYHLNTTRKIAQVTGDFDRPLQRDTASRTQTNAGLSATDLGSAFEHKGVLYFLFGDSFGRSIADADTFATSTSTVGEDLVINVPVSADGKFVVLNVPGVSLGAYEIPSGGISLNGSIYVVYTTDWNGSAGNMERSVLARSSDDGYTWTQVYDLSAAADHDMTNAHFINVSMAEVNAEDFPGAFSWHTGKTTLIYGSGAYRASNVYLAAIPSAEIETKSAMRFLAGFDSGGLPLWSTWESNAAPLFSQPQVGEFSVAWIPQVQRWVMLYNASSPRGITMRTAQTPWGPWSAGQVIMEPWRDGAYGRFMHIPWSWSHTDAFHDGGKAEVWGGEYGPYLIPRFTTGDADTCRIYYTMSTWNPYQVVLMRSEIGAPLPPESTKTATTTFMPGDADWTMTSSDFFVPATHNGSPYITTLTPQGTGARGCMWRWLPRDAANRNLRFSLYGGLAEVMVLSGGGDIPVEGETAASLYPRIKNGEFGEVVFCSWGHQSDDIDVAVDWNLRPFDRANLKVVVIDNRTASPWGYVAVSAMRLVRGPYAAGVTGWQVYGEE